MDDLICSTKQPFLCGVPARNYLGNIKESMVFKKEDITFNAIQVWWKYKYLNRTILDEIKEKPTTGFALTWQVKDASGGSVNISVDPKYENGKDLENLRKTISMVKQTRNSGAQIVQ